MDVPDGSDIPQNGLAHANDIDADGQIDQAPTTSNSPTGQTKGKGHPATARQPEMPGQIEHPGLNPALDGNQSLAFPTLNGRTFFKLSTLERSAPFKQLFRRSGSNTWEI